MTRLIPDAENHHGLEQLKLSFGLDGIRIGRDRGKVVAESHRERKRKREK